MEDRSSPERLRGLLRRRGLPHRYVERVVAELDDHRADLAAGGGSERTAEERLGDPTLLAGVVARQYHRRTFSGRHPVLTFLVAPIPLVLVGWFVLQDFGFGLSIFATREWILRHFGEVAFDGFATFLNRLVWLAPPLAIMARSCRLSVRAGRSWIWPCVTCVQMALMLGLVHTDVHLFPGGHGALTWSFDFQVRALPALAPLAMAMALVAQRRDLHRVHTC